MDIMSECNLNEITNVKNFICEYWSQDHIFVKNKSLIDFQHKSKNKYNFIISKNNEGEITSILGYIQTKQFE